MLCGIIYREMITVITKRRMKTILNVISLFIRNSTLTDTEKIRLIKEELDQLK